jgi:hypothetical protein
LNQSGANEAPTGLLEKQQTNGAGDGEDVTVLLSLQQLWVHLLLNLSTDACDAPVVQGKNE